MTSEDNRLTLHVSAGSRPVLFKDFPPRRSRRGEEVNRLEKR